MPAINLKKKHYDELVRRGYDPAEVVNALTGAFLRGKIELSLEDLKNEED